MTKPDTSPAVYVWLLDPEVIMNAITYCLQLYSKPKEFLLMNKIQYFLINFIITEAVYRARITKN